MCALIFDCDGVLVDTERDGHRVAFNKAFADAGLEIEWSIATYGQLLAVAGGMERMRHYFDEHGWPSGTEDRIDFIKNLHARKTDLFMRIIESGELPLRSGVARLMDEAIKARVKLAVCSTSNERAVHSVVEKMLGKNRYAAFDEILAGEVVSEKKPDPEIYHLALERLKVRAEDCVVIEDSRNGLLAAKGAGMHCFVTPSAYTVDENFAEADQVGSELGDPPGDCVSFDELIRWTL
ncbi:MAG TPA: HAD family hydrolase [Verrucomicrobiales bacterium]|nr:HAD family hydrolase [Verrucomicrobiales bacterium]HIL70088.1 HAD family hydrolase [Verrucomicrobiota bacterium]